MNLDAAIIKDFSLHNNNNNEFIIEISTGKILNHKLCLRSVHSHPVSRYRPTTTTLFSKGMLPQPIPFIHCFPRIKIKESYWLGSSGREVRGKGTEGRTKEPA